MEYKLGNNIEMDEYLNAIYYGIAKQMCQELLKKQMITQEEFYKIDDLNRVSFHQSFLVENLEK